MPKLKTKIEEIVSLLQSGKFTIVYWDDNEPTLYKGKWNINKECERDDYERMNKNIIDVPMFNNGYCPEIVELLVKSLGGKSDSI